jgi:hypothetical protein
MACSLSGAHRVCFIFGGDTPCRRLVLKIAVCSVKTCGRVRPEIRTHSAHFRNFYLARFVLYLLAFLGPTIVPGAGGVRYRL